MTDVVKYRSLKVLAIVVLVFASTLMDLGFLQGAVQGLALILAHQAGIYEERSRRR